VAIACFSDVHYFNADTEPLYALYAQLTSASGVVIATSPDNAAGLMLSQFLNGTSPAHLEEVQKHLKERIVTLVTRYSKDEKASQMH
jgi:hypothetical protein